MCVSPLYHPFSAQTPIIVATNIEASLIGLVDSGSRKKEHQSKHILELYSTWDLSLIHI